MFIPPAAATQKGIPPGFIDFASSSFDTIFFSNSHETLTETTSTSQRRICKRTSHLPDLVPFISLITEKCDVQPIHLVMALMYVQRFKRSLPVGFIAEPEAAHRIFVASILVASKYSEDRCLSTKEVVRATGDVWSIKEITHMEIAFLRFLHWDLYVSYEQVIQFLNGSNFNVETIMTNTFNLDDTI